MIENVRQFDVADPFGRTWQAEFRWLQNGISIRHADTVDLKYYLTSTEEKREIVVALPHPALVELAASSGRAITDAWCLQMAGARLREMIANWEDLDKTIVTLSPRELAALNDRYEADRRDHQKQAALHH